MCIPYEISSSLGLATRQSDLYMVYTQLGIYYIPYSFIFSRVYLAFSAV